MTDDESKLAFAGHEAAVLGVLGGRLDAVLGRVTALEGAFGRLKAVIAGAFATDGATRFLGVMDQIVRKGRDLTDQMSKLPGAGLALGAMASVKSNAGLDQVMRTYGAGQTSKAALLENKRLGSIDAAKVQPKRSGRPDLSDAVVDRRRPRSDSLARDTIVRQVLGAQGQPLVQKLGRGGAPGGRLAQEVNGRILAASGGVARRVGGLSQAAKASGGQKQVLGTHFAGLKVGTRDEKEESKPPITDWLIEKSKKAIIAWVSKWALKQAYKFGKKFINAKFNTELDPDTEFGKDVLGWIKGVAWPWVRGVAKKAPMRLGKAWGRFRRPAKGATSEAETSLAEEGEAGLGDTASTAASGAAAKAVVAEGLDTAELGPIAWGGSGLLAAGMQAWRHWDKKKNVADNLKSEGRSLSNFEVGVSRREAPAAALAGFIYLAPGLAGKIGTSEIQRHWDKSKSFVDNLKSERTMFKEFVGELGKGGGPVAAPPPAHPAKTILQGDLYVDHQKFGKWTAKTLAMLAGGPSSSGNNFDSSQHMPLAGMA